MKKIAVIGKKDVDSLAWNISYTLTKMNYVAQVFEASGGLEQRILNSKIRFYLSKISTKYEHYVYLQLLEEIKGFHPDLVIVISRIVPPTIINEIKNQLKIKVIFWTGDAFINLERGYALISDYDAWFVKDTYMRDFMSNKLQLNVHLIPECHNPDFHKPPHDIAFGSKNDITIAGTLYPYRAKILELLVDKFNIKIYGAIPRWIAEKWKKKHTGKYILLEDKSRVFYTSKINLNTLHYGEVNAGNCRLFEIAGSGGFQICDRKDEINNYFIEDEEIVFFDTTEELIEKINYYLEHQDEAEKIAKRAHQRALNEHTYEHRINKIFDIIGFGR